MSMALARVPVRTCVGCRVRDARFNLVRLVALDGVLTVDRFARLPGRGAWVHPTSACVASARKKRAFLRSFADQSVRVPADLFERFEDFSGPKSSGRCNADESGSEADGHPMSTQR